MSTCATKPTSGRSERAYDYWENGENCGLDDDGVLGGYGHISPTDISGSSAFLDELKSMRPILGDEKAAGTSAMRQSTKRLPHSIYVSFFLSGRFGCDARADVAFGHE